MACAVIGGPLRWEPAKMDKEGHREYKIVFPVKGDPTDGPANAMRAAGLPAVGSQWNFGADSDPWAFRKLETDVKEKKENKGPNRFFDVTLLYSTKWDTKACKDQQIDDPLLQPMKISGHFVKEKEEGITDMFGQRIVTSSWEKIGGHQNDWDDSRPQVRIEQNVALLNLYLITQMVDTVNMYPLWGLPPRTIKLSNVSWERQFYGTCGFYFKRTLEFDIKFKRKLGVRSEPTGSGTAISEVYVSRYETWDRDLMDEGTKVLFGHWNRKTGQWILDPINGAPPDPFNPRHFIRFQDMNGQFCRVVLDGLGTPAGAVIGTGTGTGGGLGGPGEIHVQKYGESDMLLLKIPVDLES